MHDTDRDSSTSMGLFVLVEESEMLEQAFPTDDAARVARFLSRWARDLRKMSAEREAGTSLTGEKLKGNDAHYAVSPLWARIFIPDESGKQVEWRFKTSLENVEELADWLVAVGKWIRRPSAGKEPPAGLAGPDSGPEPEIFVLFREGAERERALVAEMLASAPARGRRK
jgi:hypothetical protein